MFLRRLMLLFTLVGVPVLPDNIYVFAQTAATGQISGTVRDKTGAVLPGVRVTIVNLSTGARRDLITDDSGHYVATLLVPGSYRIVFELPGFKKLIQEGVRVRITETTAVDAVLQVAEVAETMTVTAETQLLQPTNPTTGRAIDESTIRQLPLATRNFQQLLTLSPGTYASISNNTELGRGDMTIYVNGQRSTSNDVRINSVDVNSPGTNSTPNIAVPATDSIQEFKVQTSLYDAAQGRNAGGAIVAVTKSGSNELHGNLYEFFRNSVLNANDFFLNAAGQKRPTLLRNQFGGTLGGRIVRDKTFFFLSYQGTRERNGASLINSLVFPTIPPGLTDANRTRGGIARAFDIPEAAINEISLKLLRARLPDGRFAIPSPATPTGLTPISDISGFTEDQFNANLDHRFSERNYFSAKLFWANNPTFQSNFNFAGLGNGPTQLPGFGGQLNIWNRVVAVADTHVFGPDLANEFRFGFSRIAVKSSPDEPFAARQFGISSPLEQLFPGMPTIQVVGLFTIGSSPFADQFSRVNTFHYMDTLSMNKGRHNIRLGSEFRRSQVNFFFNAFSRGFLIFPTFDLFLRGLSISLLGSGINDRAIRSFDFAWFFQDDFKASERLTLNLGLRYDFLGLPSEVRGRLVNFVPERFRAGTPASPAPPPNGLVQPRNARPPLPGVPFVADTLAPDDKNNFAPRFGFAYRPFATKRLVLRGGYGIYYDRPSTRFANTQVLNWPFFTIAVRVFGPLPAPFAPVPTPDKFPTAPTIPSSLPAPINGIFLDPKFRNPYVQHYNLNVQWEFAKDFMLEVGYVGTKGTKLLQVATLNQPVFDGQSGAFITPFPFLSTQKNVAGGVQQVQSGSNSHYDSLQLSVTRRFSRGLQFLASYTLAKSIDNYSGLPINELAAVPGDQRNLFLNRGLSDFDRRHRFVYSFIYDLPKLTGGSRLAKAILNDWQVAGIVLFQSGLPFSVIEFPNNFVISRANFVPGFRGSASLSGSVHSRLNRFFNTSAFASSQLTSAGRPNPAFDPNAPFGNSGRNILTGPDQRNIDFSLIRFIPINERNRLEFRAEFFNLFNTVNFANPNSNIAVPATFGKITGTSAGPRIIQFALKFNF